MFIGWKADMLFARAVGTLTTAASQSAIGGVKLGEAELMNESGSMKQTLSSIVPAVIVSLP